MTDFTAFPDDYDRVERRYRRSTEALNAWRDAQQAAIMAEYGVRTERIFEERDRDFHALGLGIGGQVPVEERRIPGPPDPPVPPLDRPVA